MINSTVILTNTFFSNPLTVLFICIAGLIVVASIFLQIKVKKMMEKEQEIYHADVRQKIDQMHSDEKEDLTEKRNARERLEESEIKIRIPSGPITVFELLDETEENEKSSF